VTLRRAIPAALVLAAAVAVLVALTARDGDAHVVNQGPAGSVNRFLAAAASGNGDRACGYLSIAETHRVERAAGRHVPCSDAFIDARLVLGRRDYLNDLRRVHVSASRDGDLARVVASHGNASVQFTLAPATVAAIGVQQYQPPQSNWRITSGATALVRPTP
jgi:hypothetical protein